MTLPEPLAVTLLVTEALESVGVRYFIAGSLASAVQGAARSTYDADLVADLRQWRDVIEVLRVQAGRLDDEYLRRWAAKLGVDDLLRRARVEAEKR